MNTSDLHLAGYVQETTGLAMPVPVQTVNFQEIFDTMYQMAQIIDQQKNTIHEMEKTASRDRARMAELEKEVFALTAIRAKLVGEVRVLEARSFTPMSPVATDFDLPDLQPRTPKKKH